MSATAIDSGCGPRLTADPRHAELPQPNEETGQDTYPRNVSTSPSTWSAIRMGRSTSSTCYPHLAAVEGQVHPWIHPTRRELPRPGAPLPALLHGPRCDRLHVAPTTEATARSGAELLLSRSPSQLHERFDPRIFRSSSRRSLTDASTRQVVYPSGLSEALRLTPTSHGRSRSPTTTSGSSSSPTRRRSPTWTVYAEKGSGIETAVRIGLDDLSVGQVVDDSNPFFTRDGDVNQEDITNRRRARLGPTRCFHFSLTAQSRRRPLLAPERPRRARAVARRSGAAAARHCARTVESSTARSFTRQPIGGRRSPVSSPTTGKGTPMSRFRLRLWLAVSILALGTAIAGGVVAATQSSDEQALQPTRHAGRSRHRVAGQRAAREDDARGEAASRSSCCRTSWSPTTRSATGSARSSASPTRSGSTSCSTIAVEESRLKIPILFAFDTIHGFRTIFPIPLGAGASFDPQVASDDHTYRRARVGRRRAQADLRADGRRLARAALGPHRRGRRARTRT